MRTTGTGGLARCAVLGVLVGGVLTIAMPADAAPDRQGPAARMSLAGSQAAASPTVRAATGRAATGRAPRYASTTRSASYAPPSDGISCVPYARMVSGIQISGNGGHWWDNAAGTYDRDQRPAPGAILAFPGSGGMRSGHVAVVARVHGPRHIEIDHANWGGPGIRRGTIMRNVDVIDVSERNDWTAVRVQVGWEQGAYGRTYPTYGFIHNRPARGMMTAFSGGAVGSAMAQPVSTRMEEVAEAGQTAPTQRGGRSRGR